MNLPITISELRYANDILEVYHNAQTHYQKRTDSTLPSKMISARLCHENAVRFAYEIHQASIKQVSVIYGVARNVPDNEPEWNGHVWLKVNGKYYDPTWEMCNDWDVTQCEYRLLGEICPPELWDFTGNDPILKHSKLYRIEKDSCDLLRIAETAGTKQGLIK